MMLSFLNNNQGAFSVLLTLMLVVATFIYVRLTRGLLLEAQHQRVIGEARRIRDHALAALEFAIQRTQYLCSVTSTCSMGLYEESRARELLAEAFRGWLEAASTFLPIQSGEHVNNYYGLLEACKEDYFEALKNVPGKKLSFEKLFVCFAKAAEVFVFLTSERTWLSQQSLENGTPELVYPSQPQAPRASDPVSS